MNLTPFVKWTGTILLLLTLNTCGGSDAGGGGTALQPLGKVIGAARDTLIVVGGFARNGTRTGYGLARILP